MLIGPIPVPNWDVASVVSRSLAFHRPLARPLFASQAQLQANFGALMAHFQARSDLTLVRADLELCGTGRCPYVAHDTPLFADDNHLSATSLERFRPRFNEALSQAFASH